MEYSFVIAIIPVILVVAFIAWIAKRITNGERIDMKEGLLGIVILMVAVLVMVPMVTSTQVYTWDEDSRELVIQKDIAGGYYAWDAYAGDVKNLVIKDGVTIEAGAFDNLTNLEYVSIGDDVEIQTNDFGSLTFTDPFGDPVESLAGFDYIKLGDEGLYQCDPTIFSYSADGKTITGFASTSGVVAAIFPRAYNGIDITEIGNSAFIDSTMEYVGSLPDSRIVTIGNSAFQRCASLVTADLPDGVTTINQNVFNGCASLVDFDFEGIEEIRGSAFYECSSLTAADLKSIRIIDTAAFQSCTAIETFFFPSSTQSIARTAFRLASGATSVTFAAGFAAELADGWANSWNFYESDGTTAIDKNVAANLAGKTFQGTAASLIEVAPGQLSLTPQQLQQVQLHTQELQDQPISFDPLPLTPTIQTTDQEASA